MSKVQAGLAAALTALTATAIANAGEIVVTDPSQTTLAVPGDFESLVGVHAIGPSGAAESGVINVRGGGGGGGGAYAGVDDAAGISAGDVLSIRVGAGGSGLSTYLKNSSGLVVVEAAAGGSAAGASGGAGGAAAASVGAVRYSGGAGGGAGVGASFFRGGGGGGGAAGPNGAGGNGGSQTANNSGGAGGGGNGGGSAGVSTSSSSYGAGGGNFAGVGGGAGPGAAGANGGGGAGGASGAASPGSSGGAGGFSLDLGSIGSGGGGGGGSRLSTLALPGGNGGGYGGGPGGGAGGPASAGQAGEPASGALVFVYKEKTLPAEQTAYWGPKTLNGHGGFDPCKGRCVLPLTALASTNFRLDDENKIVPKNGAVTTYGASRGANLLVGSEDITVTDAAGHTTVIHNVADEARAGTYTIRDKDSDTGSNFQARTVFGFVNWGEHVAWRDGSQFNTTQNTGAVLKGLAVATIRNSPAARTSIGGTWTGSNPVVMRNEVGGASRIGPLGFDGQSNSYPGQPWRLAGIRLEGLTLGGGAPGVFQLQGTFGSRLIQVWNNTISGVGGDESGAERPSAINVTATSLGWDIRNNTISHVAKGVYIQQPFGDVASDHTPGSYNDGVGQAHYVGHNLLTDVSYDAINIGCIAGTVVEYNVVSDKRTGVTIDGVSNPFNTAVQPHGDMFQIINNGCVYNRYAGPKIRYNIFLRGQGRDSLPFWTSPPYPNPNTGGSVSPGSPYATPDPTKGYGDAQGIFGSGWDAGTTLAGGVARSYPTVWVAPEIVGNVYMGVQARGVSIPFSESPKIEENVILAARPPAANLWVSPFGGATAFVTNVSGAGGTFKRNVTAAATMLTTAAGGVLAAADNVVAPAASYASYFQDPGAHPSPRTEGEFKAGYLPIQGGPLMVAPGVYAGRYCPDGTLNTGAACH